MRVYEAGDFVNKAKCFLRGPVVLAQSSRSRPHRPTRQVPPGLHHAQRRLCHSHLQHLVPFR
ncbi:uncharacterized protein LACBIDRAFT_310334 [Laccaria bicolor S238N-H82]|uniref:Predicted protein n=1 Tax=Laccaria bicolor (strain S238N-H82 / ATCC MYA-4686) TaxID=486041 RepID=B0DU48_LACBS|nr:uncharacterized protein LACBIDRAFT_310334 [Laccaria bicolor S238N-H82]EDR01841.1 predicted protein [Laccaria bicolor S238N-H82]|eukprot:XP_001887451.1 predicted protein [Laccaria bicolor S238N-H82]